MSRRIRIERKNGIPLKNEIYDIKLIDHIYYINLEHRKDRKEEILQEIKLLDPNLKKTTRVEAIKNKDGRIGCGESHILALKLAEEKNYKNILILEDDFVFDLKIKLLNEAISNTLKLDSEYNMFIIDKDVRDHKMISGDIMEVYFSLKTSSYLINKRFFPILRKCFEDCVLQLKEGGDIPIDTYWEKVMKENKKVYTTKLKLGYQRKSYSDINKK